MSLFKRLFKKSSSDIVTLASTRSGYLPSMTESYSTDYSDIDTILKIDSVVSGIIRKYVIDICGDIILPDSKSSRFLEESIIWSKLQLYLPLLVRDMFVYGHAYLLKVRGKNKKIIDIVYLNPKSISPEQDNLGNLVLDVTGNIVGYRWKPDNWYTIREKLRLSSKLEEEHKGKYIDSSDIVHIPFLDVVAGVYGEGIVAKLKTLVTIKANIEHALGEIASRYLERLWIIKVGDNIRPPSQAKLIEMNEKLREAREKGDNILVFPYYTDISIEKGEDIAQFQRPLETILTELYVSMGYAYGIEVGQRLHALSSEVDFWDKNIQFYRKWIWNHLRDQLLDEYLEQNGYKPIVKIKWRETEPSKLMSKARRLSLYARGNLLASSPDIEKEIKRIEGIGDS